MDANFYCKHFKNIFWYAKSVLQVMTQLSLKACYVISWRAITFVWALVDISERIELSPSITFLHISQNKFYLALNFLHINLILHTDFKWDLREDRWKVGKKIYVQNERGSLEAFKVCLFTWYIYFEGYKLWKYFAIYHVGFKYF